MPSPRSGRLALAAGALAAAVAGLAVRASTWTGVFTPDGVVLLPDGDPYYHARRASLLLERGEVLWRDAWLNHPLGADVPWPPLFDALLAAAAWLAGAGAPSPATAEAAFAWVPVLLGLAGAALAGAMAARATASAAAGLLAALLVALSPVHAVYSLLGRADQHALEFPLFAGLVLAFAEGCRGSATPGRRRLLAAALGLLVALSFWNWLGSALYLGFLSAFAAAWFVAAGDGRPSPTAPARVLAEGSLVAALLLAASVAALGPPGALARISIGGVSGFPVVLALLTALGAGALSVAAPRRRLARLALVAGAGALVLAVALSLPGVRAEIDRGLVAATRGNPWFGGISEFQPFLLSGRGPLAEELGRYVRTFGLLHALAVLGVLEGWRLWRSGDPAARPALALAAALVAVFVPASLAMRRFTMYGALPTALAAAAGLLLVHRAAARVRPRLAAAATALVALAALAPTARNLDFSGGALSLDPDAIAMLRRLRDAPARPDREGVLSWWDVGHQVLHVSNRPVVASPFGTEGGEGAMEDLARFWVETDPEAAERLLARRRIQYVLVTSPLVARSLVGAGPGGATPAGWSGPAPVPGGSLYDTVVARLFHAAGSAVLPARGAALGAFRLVDEGPAAVLSAEPTRVFEVVPGARLRCCGAAAGRAVVVSTRVELPGKAPSEWLAVERPDDAGCASFRLPYATGANGRARAAAYSVSDGVTTVSLAVSDADVLAAATAEVALGRAGARAAR